MKCKPWRWVWGLLPLAVWAWVTLLAERPRIEADLMQRTLATLKGAGLDWATIGVDGRDVTIFGKARDDAEPAEALRIANNNVFGVRIADAKAELIEKVEPYTWSAALNDNVVRLTGYVPSEQARKSVVEAVRGELPEAKIDDRLKFARGAPNMANWLTGIRFASKQLAALKKGVVDLSGMNLSISGEAQSAQTYQGLKSALRSDLPGVLKLESDKVSPPLIKPYVWNARLASQQLVVSGYVPSEKMRTEVLAHAKKAFPRVVDHMQLGEGAPEGLSRAALASIDQLVRLKEGEAALKAGHITLAGLAADEDTADGVTKAWKSALPGGLKAETDLRFPKVETKPVDNAAEIAAQQAAEAKRDAAAAEAAAQRRAQVEADARRKAEAEAAAADARRKAEAEAAERSKVAALDAKKKQAADVCQEQMKSLIAQGQIHFERASADLARESLSLLRRVAQAANSCPEFRVEIGGHTDAEGTPERNLKLSERRAKSVVNFLTDSGVSASRLSAVGYGETQPIAPNDTAENRARNRRIEFTVKLN